METKEPTHRSRLSLRANLLLGFGAIILLLLASAGVIVYQLSVMANANERLNRQSTRTLAAEALSRARLDLLLVVDEGIFRQDREFFIAEAQVEMENLNDRYLTFAATFTEPNLTLDTTVENLNRIIDYMIELVEGEDWVVTRRTRTYALDDEFRRVSEVVDQAVGLAQEEQSAALEEVAQAQRTVYRTVLGAILLVIVMSVFMAYTILRAFGRSVGVLASGAERLAAGDLEHRVPVTTRDELGRLAQAFNQMAEELSELYTGLEARITERTNALESLTEQMRISAEVGRAATTVLDPEELQQYVVRLVSDQFGFYHTGLFLVDEGEQYARLRAASSEGGERMLARQHQLRVGEGIVGRVVESGEPYIVLDTTQDAVHYANPDLPDTRSEVALPLRARGRIFGAIDVQSVEANAFTNENVTVFQALADQVALALDNARLYQEAQSRLHEVERLYGEYSREAWAEIARAGLRGYRFTREQGVSDEPVWYEEMTEALAERGAVQAKAGEATESGKGHALAIPVRARNQVIGVLDLRKSPEAGPWTSEEITLVETLVGQTGPTMESSRLFEETRRRAAREHAIRDITDKMERAADLQSLLRITAEELNKTLGGSRVATRIGNPVREARIEETQAPEAQASDATDGANGGKKDDEEMIV